MKRMLLFAAVFLLIGGGALCEGAEALLKSIDTQALDEVLAQNGAELKFSSLVQAFLSGEWEMDPSKAFKWLKNIAFGSFSAIYEFIPVVALPVLIWSVVKCLFPDSGAGRTRSAGYLVRVVMSLSLLRLFREIYLAAENALQVLSGLTDALVPVLVTLLTLTGGTRSAALITPMGALASRMTSHVISEASLLLVSVTAALSVANTLGGLRLKRLYDFVKRLNKWLLSTMLGAYIAMMSTGGLIAGAYDGAMLKGAKYAADQLLPIVGGDIAGAMDSLKASAQLVRSASGIAALIALSYISIKPMLLSFMASMGLKLFSALTEPVSDEDIGDLLDRFSFVFSNLLSVVAAASAIILILIGATIGLGERILG